MSQSAIRTFLDLSTSHLREQTCLQLDDHEGVVAHNLRHGWLLFVPDPADEAASGDIDWPDELVPIVELAQASGCSYVLFDADGPQLDGLPVFDW
ncbi:DUF5983 family protein [Saccharothrix syringae]|uniref:DUF5983 domain-containing protein n=1 Tax=Saccharothrix syringae TaxID=103733 RepID=A0A5Q0H3M9_SACSY|nr:hypothetical protein [Saccharothrix syringae]QFZ20525.1 hypothetical protein EKG83_26735 [Saccharothrix syringae]